MVLHWLSGRLALCVICMLFVVVACVPIAAEETKKLPLEGEVFKIQGRAAFVIMPEKGKTTLAVPWVWYAPTLPRLPGKEEVWMFKQFLDAGIAVAGIDVGESYGSPAGRALYSGFYRHLVDQRGFAKRACLLARSRGGLMLYNWAAENAESVACIAGIYPVCNLRSYPGLARAHQAYDLSEEQLKVKLSEHNPIERLNALAKVDVPIYHVHGDSDKVVPLEANSQPLADRYKELGGSITLKVVAGQGHNMWKGWFEHQPLVDFIIKHARN